MSKDSYDKNNSLIPRDIADRDVGGIPTFDPHIRRAPELGRFSVSVPTTSIKNASPEEEKQDSNKTEKEKTGRSAFGIAAKKKDEKSKTPAKPTNYRAAYIQKQKEQEEKKRKEDAEKEAKDKKILEERKKKEFETEMRVRARDLWNMIFFWRGQKGMGQYPEEVIDGNIVQLQQQLGMIDQQYWP